MARGRFGPHPRGRNGEAERLTGSDWIGPAFALVEAPRALDRPVGA